MTEDGWLGLPCLKITGSFSSLKAKVRSTQVTSVFEPRHLHKTDQNRRDELTFVPWAVDRQLLGDVTVVGP